MIPPGTLRLDVLIDVEAAALARAHHAADTSAPCYHRGGLCYVVASRPWAKETDGYRRERIAVHAALLRDLSRPESMHAALCRLGAEVGADTRHGVWWVRSYDGWYLQTPGLTIPRRVWFGFHPLGVGKIGTDAYGVRGDPDTDWNDPVAALRGVLVSMFTLPMPAPVAESGT